MQKLRLVLACFVLMLAVGSAYATSTMVAKKTVSVFYLDGTLNCVQGTVEETCPFINIADCSQLILEISQPKQIFATQLPTENPLRFTCDDPYSETDPQGGK